ncbi:MAG: type II secretion system F family protein [Prochlorothrix sp.]|nr:type II secretion system F family protein [Prochlorothrix sp.]
MANLFFQPVFQPYGLSLGQQINFFSRLSTGLGSGLSLSQSLPFASDGKPRSPLTQLTQRLNQRVSQGQSLGEALAQEHPAPFSAWIMALLRTAEYSGALDVLTRRLVTVLEVQKRRDAIQRSAIQALLLCVGGLATLVATLGRWNLTVTGLWVLTLVGGTLALMMLPGCHALRLKTPMLKGILQTRALAYLGQLSLPLACGVPIGKSLELILPHIPDPTLHRMLQACIVGVDRGKTLTEVFEGRLPPSAVQYVRTGEASGELDVMLARMGEFYEEQLEIRLQRSIGVLRPLSLLGGGAIVLSLGLGLLTTLLNALPG